MLLCLFRNFTKPLRWDKKCFSIIDSPENMNKNIFTYSSQLPLYSLACDEKRDINNGYDIAVGTFVTEYANKIELIRFEPHVEGFIQRTTLTHPYPCTKLLFAPCENNKSMVSGSLLASSGEFIRVWHIPEFEESFKETKEPSLVTVLKANNGSSPFTSMTWDRINPNIILGTSVDGSYSFYDIKNQSIVSKCRVPSGNYQSETKVIANDVSYSQSNTNIGVLGCSDGYAHIFDKRTSKCCYSFRPFSAAESLLRVECNPMRENHIACIGDGINSGAETEISIVELRKGSQSQNDQSINAQFSRLRRHKGRLNAISWAPHKNSFLCSASDDESALIWSIGEYQPVNEKPLLAYSAGKPTNNITWPKVDPQRIALTFGNQFQLLNV